MKHRRQVKARSQCLDKEGSSLETITVNSLPRCSLKGKDRILQPGTAKSSQLDSLPVCCLSFGFDALFLSCPPCHLFLQPICSKSYCVLGTMCSGTTKIFDIWFCPHSLPLLFYISEAKSPLSAQIPIKGHL